MMKPTEEKKIFVYGSLREGFFNYDKYLVNKVSPASLGKVNGKLFHLSHKGYPALLDGEEEVIGELMELKDFYKDILPVDQMEGYVSFENNSLNEYARTVMNVQNLATNEYESCYVYKYCQHSNEDFHKHAVHINHGDWKKYMSSI
ncbi:gamma-glutamylcyclotransferase family protein [Clostridium sp.]|uniref:gamma-glutamylcyclotransferase family protein n=1 Tax=Clostridium sp. TaxID=1506 RepID=UPI003217B310